MPAIARTMPHLSETVFMTDGGPETTLISHERIDLPEFAAFTLLDTPAGTASLRRYFATFARLATNTMSGLFLTVRPGRLGREVGLLHCGFGRR